ncbi:STAS domain-containing protein [Streptacidiphilus cavernicola]|uniref:STAS domain-containing protein n=1 Tax=Streptacidiphilus cavernicola TaxID=3342716 RepID=A0ABV6VPZ1_9ACTN
MVEQAWTLVVRVSGDVDCDSAHTVADALAAFPASRAIVDLSGIGFADCALVNLLLKARRTINHLVLAGPIPEQVHRLFQLSGTESAFTVAPDLAAARTLLMGSAYDSEGQPLRLTTDPSPAA